MEYEIAKYNPLFYDNNGCYQKNEWTSMSDIGKIYGDFPFQVSEYINTENHYVNTIIKVLNKCNCGYLCITYKEFDLSYVVNRIINSRHAEINKLFIDHLVYMNKCRRVHISRIELFIRLCLREMAYFEFSNVHRNVYITFGYDYYLTIICPLKRVDMNSIVCEEHLFLDPRNNH